jgi:hypothetical protein
VPVNPVPQPMGMNRPSPQHGFPSQGAAPAWMQPSLMMNAQQSSHHPPYGHVEPMDQHTYGGRLPPTPSKDVHELSRWGTPRGENIQLSSAASSPQTKSAAAAASAAASAASWSPTPTAEESDSEERGRVPIKFTSNPYWFQKRTSSETGRRGSPSPSPSEPPLGAVSPRMRLLQGVPRREATPPVFDDGEFSGLDAEMHARMKQRRGSEPVTREAKRTGRKRLDINPGSHIRQMAPRMGSSSRRRQRERGARSRSLQRRQWWHR